ncbi:MAG TPA: glycosyltransferase family 4 protein [Candidatus Angelobacter sp.]|nr:glycosyltransferase family 4 protein [Candidatus Angelobacter sp.]
MSKRKLRVGLISSYVPKKCGIATHSRDLIEAIHNNSGFDWRLIAAEDAKDSYSYNGKDVAVLKKDSLESYEAAAKAMNEWQPDVVLLEHEFGLYGGSWVDIEQNGIARHDPTGDYILTLINALSAPIITTLHTVIPEPDEIRRNVMRSISERSTKLITMTEDARTTLNFYYGIDEKHIEVIPHGVPQPTKRDKKIVLEELGLDSDRFYLLITGLIGPNKSIDSVIKSLPEIIERHPEVTLLVVGQTHPDILAAVGEEYRESLISLADELGVSQSLQFVNEYLPIEKLVDYFTIADIYFTIHKDPEQSASGTLAYSLGCGLAAISTPYRYAKEVLADGRGFLVPFGSVQAITDQVNNLIENTDLRQQAREKAMAFGSSMSWGKVADAYIDLLKEIIKE